LQATKEALEELKHNNQSLQTDNTELKMRLHEEKEGKHFLLQQLKAKDEVWGGGGASPPPLFIYIFCF